MGATATGNIGYGSEVINGQLVNVAPGQAFNPLTMGQAYSPSQMWPRQGVYNLPPVLPSPALQLSQSPWAFGSSGYGSPVFPTATSASGNPFHVSKSPLLWALGFLIVGTLMLQHIHWK